jgi:catalase (peroxidase I)
MSDEIREGDRVSITYATGNEDRTHEGTLVEKFDGGLRVDVDSEYAADPEALVIEGIKVVNPTTDESTSVLGGLKDIEVVERDEEAEEPEVAV